MCTLCAHMGGGSIKCLRIGLSGSCKNLERSIKVHLDSHNCHITNAPHYTHYITTATHHMTPPQRITHHITRLLHFTTLQSPHTAPHITLHHLQYCTSDCCLLETSIPRLICRRFCNKEPVMTTCPSKIAGLAEWDRLLSESPAKPQ